MCKCPDRIHISWMGHIPVFGKFCKFKSNQIKFNFKHLHNKLYLCICAFTLIARQITVLLLIGHAVLNFTVHICDDHAPNRAIPRLDNRK